MFTSLIICKFVLCELYTITCFFFPVIFFCSGVRIFVDKKAQLTLLGTEMDYVESKLGHEFVFNNPNIRGTCGCGESFHL